FAASKTLRNFGDIITGDDIVVTSGANPQGRGGAGERHCFVLKDRATNFVGAYPCRTKTSVEVAACIQHFLGTDKCRTFYSDNAREVKAAVGALGISHATSTPYRHQSNGIIERTHRLLQDGTKAALETAGLPLPFWNYAVRHVAHVSNVVKSPSRPITAWVLRHQEDPFTPQVLIPFGALIYIKTGLPREHPFAPGSKPAIFLGYHLQPGCVWKKEFYATLLSDIHKVNFLTGVISGHLQVYVTRECWCDLQSPYTFPCQKPWRDAVESISRPVPLPTPTLDDAFEADLPEVESPHPDVLQRHQVLDRSMQYSDVEECLEEDEEADLVITDAEDEIPSGCAEDACGQLSPHIPSYGVDPDDDTPAV
ncbi:MAG: transposase family protein, partial [Deltaproteobacteria bacterium]|nr:transposase family protein [Deltaproteobacteria bacterium]